MVNVLIVRHAATADTGSRLSGRAAGVHLTRAGRSDAERLGRRLALTPLAAVYSGPLERVRETAAAIARPHALPVMLEPALTEIDFGRWTGRTFQSLDAEDAWRIFNRCPAEARIPEGESLEGVTRRGAAALTTLAGAHRDGETIVAVTHGDVIRLAIARLLGLPLAAFRGFEASPASMSCVRLGEGGAVLAFLNERPGEHGRDGGMTT